MKTGTKFKVGDRIRVLPLAANYSVPPEEIGKTGVIKHYYNLTDIRVFMDKPWFMWNRRETWCVKFTHIELERVVGEQLMFPFMEEGR